MKADALGLTLPEASPAGDPLHWCCPTCRRPVIDLAPYAPSRSISPFATIGDLMRRPIPSVWRPLARWLWIRRLKTCVRHELKRQYVFEGRLKSVRDHSEKL